jgi:hypothetical protein
MRRYSIFLRGKYYYAQIKNPITGEHLSAKSTGQTDMSEAQMDGPEKNAMSMK